MTVPPPPGRRVPRRNNKTWEGGWAPWMSVEDMDTGRASRAEPEIQEAMAGQEVQEAMADPGLREAMADPGLREATADPGLREATADLEARETMAYFFWAAMVGQGSPWPWLWARPPRQRIYSPPPKFSWGSSPLVGILEERALEEALEKRVLGGALEERVLGGALEERTLGGALEARALSGLWRSGH